MAAVGVACLVLSWLETAHAQVKLQYKYPEGKKLSYKRSDKTRQLLTSMGMEIPSDDGKPSSCRSWLASVAVMGPCR